MSLILHIDTALETANVCISENGNPLKVLYNLKQKDHAAFVHEAISDISKSLSLGLPQLSAVAVTNGPGSYTGLRVGMSAAKGLCYALNKPLLTINCLEAMANDVKKRLSDSKILLCPMIDARRMEVYTALYDADLNQVLAPLAMILDHTSFSEYLSQNKVLFFGNGSDKFRNVVAKHESCFTHVSDIALSISELAYARFQSGNFENLTFTEPFYLKEYQN